MFVVVNAKEGFEVSLQGKPGTQLRKMGDGFDLGDGATYSIADWVDSKG